MSNEKIGQRAAGAFRREFNLGSEPIANVARLIEQTVRVGVAYVGGAPSGHGLTMCEGDQYMMAVGCTEHPMRLRSTLAHELGHLRLKSVDRCVHDNDWAERRPEEIQADAFARHLLIPIEAVEETASASGQVTTAVLSDLVQRYMASPKMVAIQLRTARAIDEDTCEAWGRLSAGHLASQFGWHSEYQALVDQSKTPRPPQALLARAVEGYRWNLITPATIARLNGKTNPRLVAQQLKDDGIVPEDCSDIVPERPTDVGESLTAEELALLRGDAD